MVMQYDRLDTELNRVHQLFRPALCRRLPEPDTSPQSAQDFTGGVKA